MRTAGRNRLQIAGTMLTLLLTMISFFSVYSQTNWYVSQQNGSDGNNGLSPSAPFKTVDYALDRLQPGDTLLLMGVFTNEHFIPGYTYSDDINDPHIWLDEHTIRISGLNGSPGNYITLKPYDENTVIKGDGANIIRVLNSSYLQFEGLHIYGEVENIPMSTALALQFLYRDPDTDEVLYRVPPGTPDEEVENMILPVLGSVSRPTYTNTRGIYLSNVHHVTIRSNTIHHAPGVGLTVSYCEYIDIIENEVHNCSRKSYTGTHALVVTKATSTDNLNNYKINILRNEVHHNYNEIYSWSPQKSFITPRIDEGKGISLQRNSEDSWKHGRFLVANNLCYWNGFSGVHTNTGKRMDFINNTCYLNSYTNTVTYAGEEQKGKNIGISAQASDDIRIINNVVYIDNAWGGYPISVSNTNTFTVSDNIIFGINGPLVEDTEVIEVQVNTMVEDPLFMDTDNYDFNLQSGSPAIGMANAEFAPVNDFNGNPRDEDPDMGALEYDGNLAIENEISAAAIRIFPNPFSEFITIRGDEAIERLELYSLTGQRIQMINDGTANSSIDLSFLKEGTYVIRVNDYVTTIIKR